VGLRENTDVGINVRHVSVNRDGTMWNAPGSTSARLLGSHGLPGDLLSAVLEQLLPPRDLCLVPAPEDGLRCVLQGQDRRWGMWSFTSNRFGGCFEAMVAREG